MPNRELYDERFSALRLTDSCRFTDPRQYYYTTYVVARAGLHDDFGKTLSSLEERALLARFGGDGDVRGSGADAVSNSYRLRAHAAAAQVFDHADPGGVVPDGPYPLTSGRRR
jgi:hypothetical protein